jgi:hypothetical protein
MDELDERSVRAVLIEGLDAGAAYQIYPPVVRSAFLAGDIDFTFAELDMDSFAYIELCMAIEVGTGVSLAPDDLGRYASLGTLAQSLVGRNRA